VTRPSINAARGFSLVTAIFLLVVLAGLGAFIVSTTTTQHTTIALDVQGSRAEQSARAGIEWAAFQVLDPNAADTSDTPPACPVSPTDLTLSGTLSPFAVRVTCARTTAKEGSNTIGAYTIVSTACNQGPCPNAGPNAGYVERRIQAVFTKCKNPSNTPSKRC
jgi:MSHA biogenesis protein MshP